MSFAGTVTMEERDDAAHRVVLHAKGMEAKGKGAANAEGDLVAGARPDATAPRPVKMQADITLTGAAAQLSRGLLPEISKKLTQQFADCLAGVDGGGADARDAAAATARSGAAAAAPPSRWPPSPSAASAWASRRVWSIITNFFRKLFGRKPKS